MKISEKTKKQLHKNMVTDFGAAPIEYIVSVHLRNLFAKYGRNRVMDIVNTLFSDSVTPFKLPNSENR